MALRISESVKIGPFRLGGSIPLTGKGRPVVRVGTRTGRRGWTSVSAPVGGKKRKTR
jgi:hypothetical protein